MGLALAIDLDGLADLIEDSTPWLECWAVLLAIAIIIAVAHRIRRAIRRSQDPVVNVKRRAF